MDYPGGGFQPVLRSYCVTVSKVEALCCEPPLGVNVAVMVVVPCPTMVAVPGVAKVATALFDDVQLAELVTVVPLDVAVKLTKVCADWLTVEFCGEMLSVFVVLLTLTEVEPETDPEVAVIVAEPTAIPLTSPVVLTVAIDASEVVHVRLGRFEVVLPSLLLPLAVSCTVALGLIEGESGVTAMDESCGFTKKPRQLAPAMIISTANAVVGTSPFFDIGLMQTRKHTAAVRLVRDCCGKF